MHDGKEICQILQVSSPYFYLESLERLLNDQPADEDSFERSIIGSWPAS